MSGFKVNFSVNNQLATPSMHAAALANRPAAGQPGRVFIDTDNPSTGIYRDTGTVWVQIAETATSDVDTLQNVTDNGNTTDNTLILTYDSLFNGSNQIEFFDVGTTAVRYSINKVGTGNRLTIQGNSPLSTFDMGLMIDAPNNTLRTYFGSSFETKGISLDFTNNIYRVGNITGTAGQQGIYIDSIGEVGIGNTSPSYLLDVNGTARVSANIYLATNAIGNLVGIGTTSPSSKLHVVTGNVDGIRVESSNSGYIELGKTASNRWRWANDYSSAGLFELQYGNNTTPTTTRLKITSDGNAEFSSSASSGYGLYTNRTIGSGLGAQFAVSSGNVLIGTTTDAGYKLDVSGTLRSTQGANFATSSGNVGIGTTSPSTKLVLNQTSTAEQKLSFQLNNTEYGGLYVNTASGTAGFNSSYGIAINVGATKGIGISSSNVSIFYGGTGNGIRTLDVTGSIGDSWGGTGRYLLGETGSPMYSFIGDTDNGWSRAGADIQAWTTAGTEKMRLTAAGRLLLGTTTESTFLLDVNGTARVREYLYMVRQDGAATIDALRYVTGGTIDIGTTFRVLGTNQWSANTGTTAYIQNNFGSKVFASQPNQNGSFTINDFQTTSLSPTIPASYNQKVIGSSFTISSTAVNNFFGLDIRATDNSSSIANNVYGVYADATLGTNTSANRWAGYFVGRGYFSQVLAIGTTSPNASALLDVSSTTRGFLPPRMTNAQMVAIATPAAGLVVYDTTNNKLNVYDGTNWVATH